MLTENQSLFNLSTPLQESAAETSRLHYFPQTYPQAFADEWG
jgi:hypothetical protein